jgi:UDP-N-acetylglucosamine 2-epimerase (non-hydrolysing)
MKIVIVSGARPNYMKIAPIVWAIRRLNQTSLLKLEFVLVHTGQHYDHNLFGVFFEELGLPAPDFCLDVGSGSRNYQIETVIERLEPVLENVHPDLVLVVGDVNSTLAAALAGVKRRIQVAHVEAGLRSFDQTMPEEVNRRLTDSLSDYLFVTEESGRKNLLREGVTADKIFFVGNVMIDSLQQLRRLWERAPIHDDMGLEKNGYGVVTLHRPSNVDNQEVLAGIVDALVEVAHELPVIFPVHPRTQKQLEATTSANGVVRLGERRVTGPGLYCIEPLGYLDFMALLAGARLVMTDSGGIQEEATVLNVPCLTLRENTERPVTITHGTNKLVGTSREKIIAESGQILSGGRPALYPPPLWDGRAADRIVAVLNEQGRRSQPRRAAAPARSAVSRSDKPPLG